MSKHLKLGGRLIVSAIVFALILSFASGCATPSAAPAVNDFCDLYRPVTDTTSPQTDENNAIYLVRCLDATSE